MTAELKEALLERCREMEIPLVGVAAADRWADPPFEPWIPEDFWPQAIYPEARSVVVIGLPITLPALETSPSVWYRELYRTVNILLDQYTTGSQTSSTTGVFLRPSSPGTGTPTSRRS